MYDQNTSRSLFGDLAAEDRELLKRLFGIRLQTLLRLSGRNDFRKIACNWEVEYPKETGL